jgi:hypothetical protein
MLRAGYPLIITMYGTRHVHRRGKPIFPYLGESRKSPSVFESLVKYSCPPHLFPDRTFTLILR